jgi:hypothetical protein
VIGRTATVFSSASCQRSSETDNLHSMEATSPSRLATRASPAAGAAAVAMRPWLPAIRSKPGEQHIRYCIARHQPNASPDSGVTATMAMARGQASSRVRESMAPTHAARELLMLNSFEKQQQAARQHHCSTLANTTLQHCYSSNVKMPVQQGRTVKKGGIVGFGSAHLCFHPETP